MEQAGLPRPMAEVFASFDANTASGSVAQVTGDFERLTGKRARPFEAWLDDHKAALANLG